MMSGSVAGEKGGEVSDKGEMGVIDNISFKFWQLEVPRKKEVQKLQSLVIAKQINCDSQNIKSEVTQKNF